MKIIAYKLRREVNRGTEENPDIVQTFYNKKIECKTQSDYNANYPIAEAEAVPGTIEVTGDFDPEPEPAPGTEELEAENEDMRNALGVLGVTV